MAVIPKNGDNDVKAGVVKETVELNRQSPSRQKSDTNDWIRIDKTRRGCCVLIEQHGKYMHDVTCHRHHCEN